ncbi:MAG TPA: acetate/propionate family kinase [Bacteroidetes bacterium]|nr:acetate/propionate family kinase [Bacteroidota bacterium]
MKILIANPGSTSYKCKLLNMTDADVIFQATVERIGDEAGIYSCQFSGEKEMKSVRNIPDYFAAINLTLDTLREKISLRDVAAVGFKTVLAKNVTGCVELTDAVLAAMKAYQPLAPVHTQVYLTAISVFKQMDVNFPLVGLFETAFHSHLPPEAYLYGIPYKYYEEHGIRKYGFHGASHRYIARRTEELFGTGKQPFRAISCHLGGSSSICAIRDGISLDTSMGMSPQSGLLNAKRTGDLDPFALLYLMEQEKLSIAEIRDILISQSGIFGIDGRSGDLRDVIEAMEKGNERSALAFKTFAYYVKRYIGEYLAILNGADVIAFTAGSGQNSPQLRMGILQNTENLGIILDEAKNNANPKEGLISADHSTVKVAVIPTNEEYIVAREVEKHLSGKNSGI